MKLSDFLFNIGRPVAFYPGLAKALGSIKQAVFVCQMAYWKDKGSDPDGWIYKTAEDIETETALTYKEQTTVRAALVEKKALQERYARTEHQMYFRVDWDRVNALWDEHLTKGHMPNGKMAPSQKSDGILPKVSSLNSNTENTHKNTQKRGDLLDAEIHYHLKPKAIRDAFRDFFKLTPNWETKFHRQFLEWAVEEKITPEQIKLASEVWGSDKKFNWAHPNLKGIQEQWLQLIEGQQPAPDNFMAEYEAKRERVRLMRAGRQAA